MAVPTDPLLANQWHLIQPDAGEFDLNVLGAWQLGYTGAGTRTLVIDDGFDYTHPDLFPNYDQFLDFDWDALDNGDNGSHDLDPFGNPGDAHGTAVAGIIGADDNGTGAVGVAFDTSLVGYRIHGFINDGWLQDVRDSIHHAAVSAGADVTNISQGIANDLNSEFGTGYNAVRFDEIETSIGTAVNSGRGGLGMTIVKSAGNSRAGNYDVNADDWTNDTRQVVVGAVNQDGFVSSYSSYGAALLVSGFGTPGEVVTTDRVGGAGYDATDFTSSFNGTSAAAPMVAGVVALMYDANSALGWRDVQTILAYTARHVGSDIGAGIAGAERYAWQWNAANTWNGGGLHFSNDYGYGLVDATAAVLLAETWLDTTSAQTTANEFINSMDMLDVATVIPDGNAAGLEFTGNAGFDDEVDRVTVQVTFSTTFTADLALYVTSPDGTVSELIDNVGGSTDFNGTWTFETQAFRGERAQGTWTVRVVDQFGADVLNVSDIIVTTFGRFSTSDRYVFTNEYGIFGGVAGHDTITDTNGGTDSLNASAVTSNSIINLTAGSVSTIAGQSLTIAVGTLIEDAYGGLGNDTITGNHLVNRLLGGRGNDTLDGGLDADQMFGGAGNDIYYVNSIGDIASEAGGSGTDKVFATQHHTLGAGVENLEMIGVSAINGTGNTLNNVIIGNSAANVINGMTGADVMNGKGGNDTYHVDNLLDVVSEDGGSGTDKVFSSVSFTLGTGLENLELTGGSAIDGTGNGLNNVIIGNSGANVLNGLTGADTMNGKFGNDIYHVDNASDVVSEAGGGGTDKVFSSVSFTLATGLENLQLSGASAINGTGNGVNNVINGNAAANVINGLAGGDTMAGAGGNDTYHVDNLVDKVFEGPGGGTDKVFHSVSFNIGTQAIENLEMTGGGSISAVGGTANNIIIGNSGANFFDGREGSDLIVTGGNTDTIRFSTALGATNVDTITDFFAPGDQFQLVQAIFSILPLGGLAAAAFKDLTAGAIDATDRIIYDRLNGDLFYDQDGNGGGFAQFKFADLSNNALISNADFVVI